MDDKPKGLGLADSKPKVILGGPASDNTVVSASTAPITAFGRKIKAATSGSPRASSKKAPEPVTVPAPDIPLTGRPSYETNTRASYETTRPSYDMSSKAIDPLLNPSSTLPSNTESVPKRRSGDTSYQGAVVKQLTPEDEAKAFMTKCKVLPLQPLNPDPSIDGLRALANRRDWVKVAKCVAKWETDKVIEYDDVRVQVEFKRYRIVALIHCRQYKNAKEEVEQLGNLDDEKYYYDSYPDKYPGKSGSLIPFPLRIVIAELNHYLGDSKVCIDKLYELLTGLDVHIAELNDTTSSRVKERAASAQQIKDVHSYVENMGVMEAYAWRRQIICSLINQFCVMNEPLTALDLCKSLLQHEQMQSTMKLDPIDICSYPYAYARAFRICIQMGNIPYAEKYFEIVKKSLGNSDTHPIVIIQKGLLLFAKKMFQASLDTFSQVVKMEIDFTLTHSLIDIGVSVDELFIVAANNIAVAALHCCEVRLGVNCIEALIQKDPSRFMTDPIIFNLCTLYDLAFNSIYSTRRKKMLQTLAKLYHLNTINPISFRL